jgi:acyl-coenzyme A thioesterase PaaI-like protein
VLGTQNVSRMCVVCGTDNACGLHARFFELDGGELACLFTPAEHHQGYPGRLHGGIASAVIDETIGRAITAVEPDTWYVTVEATARYLRLPAEKIAAGAITERDWFADPGTLPDGIDL